MWLVVSGSVLALIGVGYALKMWTLSTMSVKNKVVVISGASSGLGEALARRFHELGAKLVLLARSVDRLAALASALDASGLNGHRVKYARFDLAGAVTDEEIDEIVELYGGVDILVNNAGMSYRGTIADTTLFVHRQLMEVNYFGHLKLTTGLLPDLRRVKGAVVAISSIQGRVAIPYRSAYSASKHAFQAFFDTLRAEEYPRVRVLVVSPGYIRTNLSKNAVTSSGNQHGKMDETTASGMAPEELAKIVVQGLIRGEHEITWRTEAVWLRSLLPNLYFWVMALRAKKGRKEFTKAG